MNSKLITKYISYIKNYSATNKNKKRKYNIINSNQLYYPLYIYIIALLVKACGKNKESSISSQESDQDYNANKIDLETAVNDNALKKAAGIYPPLKDAEEFKNEDSSAELITRAKEVAITSKEEATPQGIAQSILTGERVQESTPKKSLPGTADKKAIHKSIPEFPPPSIVALQAQTKAGGAVPTPPKEEANVTIYKKEEATPQVQSKGGEAVPTISKDEITVPPAAEKEVSAKVTLPQEKINTTIYEEELTEFIPPKDKQQVDSSNTKNYTRLPEVGDGNCGPKAMVEMIRGVRGDKNSKTTPYKEYYKNGGEKLMRKDTVKLVEHFKKLEISEHFKDLIHKTPEQRKDYAKQYLKSLQLILSQENGYEIFKFLSKKAYLDKEKTEHNATEDFNASIDEFTTIYNKFTILPILPLNEEDKKSINVIFRNNNLGKQPTTQDEDLIKKWCSFISKFPIFVELYTDNTKPDFFSITQTELIEKGYKEVSANASLEFSNEEISNLKLQAELHAIGPRTLNADKRKELIQNSEEFKKYFPTLQKIIKHSTNKVFDRKITEDQLNESNLKNALELLKYKTPLSHLDKIKDGIKIICQCKNFSELADKLDNDIIEVLADVGNLGVSVDNILVDHHINLPEKRKKTLEFLQKKISKSKEHDSKLQLLAYKYTLYKVEQDGNQKKLSSYLERVSTAPSEWFTTDEIKIGLLAHGLIFNSINIDEHTEKIYLEFIDCITGQIIAAWNSADSLQQDFSYARGSHWVAHAVKIDGQDVFDKSITNLDLDDLEVSGDDSALSPNI